MVSAVSAFVKCRLGYRVALPCNWVKDGFCGEDGNLCKILEIVS